MRGPFTIVLVAASIIGSSPVFHGQTSIPPQGSVTERASSIEDVIGRINKSEAALVARMRIYRPLIEVYIQDLASDPKLGSVPTKDYYFLGQFQWQDGPKMEGLNRVKTNFKGPGLLKRPLGVQYLPDGFASMTAPDWNLLDPKRYEFKFARREFLGEARCLVFDVRPLDNSRVGFSGRIWVEDRDYNIVRFNGINRGVDTTLSGFFRKKLSFHVDSWRVNVLPGQWLPSYVYGEEADPDGKAAAPRQPRIKSQVRIWAYQSAIEQKEQQFTDILIDEPSVRDSTDTAKQLSPVESQRRWELEAEENIIDRLSKGGFLAPAGEVDKVLETVVNNLVVTNTLTLDAPVRCRVLLTSPLESFTVGHTIVLSRGLIDVLPDEASLAMMLAHELSHVVLGHP